jgi:multidrug efflux system membrane fusion protein
VEPIQSASVTAQVDGLVKRVAFREGDDVRAGQALFVLDSAPFQAAADRAAAVLTRDRAQAETARLDYERAQSLAERSVISDAELQGKRADSEALTATVRADSRRWSARVSISPTPPSGRRSPARPAASRCAPRRVCATTARRSSAFARSSRSCALHRDAGDLPEVRRQRDHPVRVEIAAARMTRCGSKAGWRSWTTPSTRQTGTLLLKAETPNPRRGAVAGPVRARAAPVVRPAQAIVIPSVAVNNSQRGRIAKS